MTGVLIRRGEDIERHRGKGHGKKEAENGGMQLQAREYQGLQGLTREGRKR